MNHTFRYLKCCSVALVAAIATGAVTTGALASDIKFFVTGPGIQFNWSVHNGFNVAGISDDGTQIVATSSSLLGTPKVITIDVATGATVTQWAGNSFARGFGLWSGDGSTSNVIVGAGYNSTGQNNPKAYFGRVPTNLGILKDITNNNAVCVPALVNNVSVDFATGNGWMVGKGIGVAAGHGMAWRITAGNITNVLAAWQQNGSLYEDSQTSSGGCELNGVSNAGIAAAKDGQHGAALVNLNLNNNTDSFFDIPPFAGGLGGVANAISAGAVFGETPAGYAGGYFSIPFVDTNTDGKRAFRYALGSAISEELFPIGGDILDVKQEANILDISDNGIAVGYSNAAGGPGNVAAIWLPGVPTAYAAQDLLASEGVSLPEGYSRLTVVTSITAVPNGEGLYSIAGQAMKDDGNTEAFVATITGQVPCTPPATPGLPRVIASGAFAPGTDFLWVGMASLDDTTKYYAFRVDGSQFVQADGTLGAAPVYRLKTEWGPTTTGLVKVIGLTSNTTYTFESQASEFTSGLCPSAFSEPRSGTTKADCTLITFYADADNDGYGNPSVSVQACTAPTGYVANNTDCDDTNAAVNPGAAEVCNNLDDNCNGEVDEGLPTETYYVDADGDGFGDPAVSVVACSAPEGYVLDNTDCDDADDTVYPGATEILDGKDNNCDGQIDEGLSQTVVTARNVFYNNSYYDGNKVGIDEVPGVGTRDDDADAIDPSKTPLVSGTSTFANVTGYNKGLNGLIYEVEVADGDSDPEAADFTFSNLSRTGTAAPTAIEPSASAVIVLQASAPRKVRVVFTFADNSLKNTWVQVDIGTGFGAAAETHYWGNAAGDTGMGNVSPNFLTNGSDELGARSNPTTVVTRSLVSDPFDINKTSLVDGSDQLWIRSNGTTAVTCLKYVTK